MGSGKGNTWNNRQYCGCAFATFIGCSLALITIVLLALSLPKVNEGEQAIRYDDVSNKLHSDILSPGIQVVQPDSILIRYPARFENTDLEMTCRTQDGIEIELSLTFQYTYIASKLVQSYLVLGEKDANDNYMILHVKSVIYETCSRYKAVNFTESRGLIEFDMSNSVKDIMNYTNTQLGQFQLRNFVYPIAFQNAVNAKQQTRQQIEIVQRQRAATITTAQTGLIQAIQRVEIQINNANAEAERLIREATLAAQTTIATWDQTILSIDAEMTNLGLTFEEYVNYLNNLLIGSAHKGIVRVP